VVTSVRLSKIHVVTSRWLSKIAWLRLSG
jgi:hypothetical protein